MKSAMPYMKHRPVFDATLSRSKLGVGFTLNLWEQDCNYAYRCESIDQYKIIPQARKIIFGLLASSQASLLPQMIRHAKK
jgi:hypothetical protein